MRAFSKRARIRALWARTALALLTLYVFNIYPMSYSQDGPLPSLSVEALFDFEVPVGVVSQGVADAVSGVIGDFPSDSYADTMEGIYERNGWTYGWETIREAEWGISTNGFDRVGDTNGAMVFVDPYLLEGVNQAYIDSATLAPSVPTSSVPLSSLPVADFDLLRGVWDYLDDDTPSLTPVGLPSSPVVSDALFGSFWVPQLTYEMILDFDGGHLDSVIGSLPAGGVFGWVLPTWTGTLHKVVDFVHENPDGIRKYVRFVAVILYWAALYRYLIKRIAFTIQTIFEGTAS